ncbi:hypothetical protein [Segatella copri]|uniref:Outer membrane protein beta-barrel domain-containing protein n=1 Tax=Segatella copri TaxID=165179 RepID=A0AAW5USQ0_9BACT|nr:hypothetical protein [Segatella copri]MCW4112458.1 hypothetical protein [Segatella copri]MCW4119323.1 hypothetical protein [Segatella copri]MCW4122634.1 hypothetical protein [Segatella copri]MCW4156405.1 hypothetical protein [Segatella copri]WOF97459.1 hypothetical protein RJT12_01460 [Segatella copri]
MAQQKTRNLSVELLGAQNIVGINYDSRFDGNSGLGYRIGIGYGYGDNSGLFDQKINGVGVPLELNYLLGKKNSKLELGFGASLGVYQVKETIGYVKDTGWYPGGENTDETSPKIDFYTSSKTQFGYFLFGNIGYRYQRPNGFMFRVGVSPSFNFGDKYGLKKAAFFPYIGLGWSF